MPDWRAYVRGHLPPLRLAPEREAEIVGELSQQIEQAYSEALAAGASEESATSTALAQFPDWSGLAREIEAAERTAPPEPPALGASGLVASTLQDLRYGFRQLRSNPAFFFVAVLTMAFGIGASAAIFTIVDTLALRPLPYPRADRLLAIETRKSREPEIGSWTSALDFYDLKERTRSFSTLVGLSPVWTLVLTGGGGAERLEALFVSAELFPMLGVKPLLGRAFLPQEDLRGKDANVVILSHAFWQRRFGGDENVLGRVVTLDGSPCTVIGVLPPDFQYLGDPVVGTAASIDVWLPLASNPIMSTLRGVRFLGVAGRLKDGVDPAQARQEVRALGAALAGKFPDSNGGYEMLARPLRDQATGPLRPALYLLLGSVGFVLLMACVNVANLLLARTAVRRKEFAVRVALGGSTARLVRQLLTEAVLLAAAGGLAGALLASGLLRLLVAASPPAFLRRHVALDSRVLAFTLATVLAGALISSLPAVWRIWRAEAPDALREAGRGLTAGHRRLRSALVTSQMTLALVLLVGAGLLIRSFVRLLDVDPGFNTESVVTLSTQVPMTAREPSQRAAIYRALRDRIRELPGVIDVGAVSRLPLRGQQIGSWLWPEGHPFTGEKREVEYRVATPSYFPTMGIRLLRGRLFDDSDDSRPASVLLVNEAAARKYWPGEDPIGRRVKLGPNPETASWVTVIGIVSDVRHFGMDIAPRPEIYRPYAHNPLFNPILVVRTKGDPGAAISSLSAAVRSTNRDMPVYNVFTMRDLVSRSVAQRRFLMWLVGAFAAAALLLAAVGLYGVASETVVQRTREIGLRMALGATGGEVSRMIVRQGLVLMALGGAIGCLAAVGLTRLIAGLLFGVRPLDVVAFLAAAAALGAVTLAACYVPARRATRVDPLTALRHE